MMRIVQQTFSEQDMITVLKTDFSVMGSEMTDKAMTSNKEEVHIIIRQMRKGIEGITVNGHKDKREHL
jgi:hypothetical protein